MINIVKLLKDNVLFFTTTTPLLQSFSSLEIGYLLDSKKPRSHRILQCSGCGLAIESRRFFALFLASCGEKTIKNKICLFCSTGAILKLNGSRSREVLHSQSKKLLAATNQICWKRYCQILIAIVFPFEHVGNPITVTSTGTITIFKMQEQKC